MPAPDLVINAPREGIAQSPHIGFGDVRMCDVHTIPGVIQLNNKNVLVSSTTVTGQPKWKIRDPVNTENVYAIDDGGKVYKSANDGVTWAVLGGASASSAHGNGLQIWKDYLFVARDTALDTYGPLAGATVTVVAATDLFTKTAHGLAAGDKIIFSTSDTLPAPLVVGTVYYVIAAGLTADDFEISTTSGGAVLDITDTGTGTHKYSAWKQAFKTIDSDVLWHPMIISKNDSKLYGGAGKYVFSLDEVSGQTFVAGTAATYTWTQQALDLPTSYRIKCLDELGNNLFNGTWQGTAINDILIADIFPWDRSSTSFSQPIILAEYGVHAMKNIGGSLVVLAGISGMIYRCDGASAYPIGKLPIDLSGGKFLEWFPGAICNFKDKVFFGVGDAGTTADRIGIYSLLQTGKGNILALEYLNSQLTDGGATTVNVSALLPITRNTLLSGFRSDSTYGIDLTSATTYLHTTSYSGYFDSPLYVVGTINNKRSFTELEFQLAKELATGEGIRIQYRVNLTDDFTTIDSYTYTKLGAIISHHAAADIPACEMLQIRVGLLGTATTTPELKSITLR